MAFSFKKILTKQPSSKEERLAEINANKEVRVAEASRRPEIITARSKEIVAYTFCIISVILLILLIAGTISFTQFMYAVGASGIGSWLNKLFS